MHSFIGLRLSIMMFLQFFIWGAWYVTAPGFLGTIGFVDIDFGDTYSVGPIAAMISPFFVGMIADRFFATERVLGVMHLAGGAIMLAATVLMTGEHSAKVLNLIFFAHMFCYMPTLALTNSLAMQNMTDPEKQFPMIRVFGTIGWIIAGFALDGFQIIFKHFEIETWKWGASINMFYLAGGAAIVLGLFSFTLPHTPPPQAGKKVSVRELLGLDAFVLLKQKPFLIFMASSLLICIPLAFYYQMAARSAEATGIKDIATRMSFGQVSEIVFMVLMPFFFRRLGVKWMLLVGMLAWVVRYFLFAIGTPDEISSMVMVGIILHGICYDFFFVTGQIYTDKLAPESIRSQAQGMLVLFTLGFGMLIGAQIAGRVEGKYTPEVSSNLNKEVKAIGKDIADLNQKIEAATGAENSAIKDEIKELKTEKKTKRLAALKAMDWRSIWMIPAIGAALIMILFGLLFKDEEPQDAVVQSQQLAGDDAPPGDS